MTDDDISKRRFLALTLIRLSGVVLAFIGVSIVSKRWIEPADLIGYAFILVGAFDVMVVPLLLARRWRTPPTP